METGHEGWKMGKAVRMQETLAKQTQTALQTRDDRALIRGQRAGPGAWGHGGKREAEGGPLGSPEQSWLSLCSQKK